MLNSLKFPPNKNISLVFLISLWAIIQAFAYFHFDMRTSVDSDLYIGIAENLLQGKLPEGRETYYFSYGFLVAIPMFFGLSYEFVLMIHFTLALASLVCLYKLASEISGSIQVGFIAGLLFVLWFKFQQWNLIVYTDASFAHLTMISVFCLHKANSKLHYFLAIAMIIFTAFLRPTGMGFLFAIFAYFGFSSFEAIFKNKFFGVSISVLAFCIFLVLLNFAMSHYINWFIESYAKAEIIYPNESLFVQKPENLTFPNENHIPLIRLITFFLYNPVYMFKITALKMALFIGHIKPYYSISHNIFIVGFLYPIYFFAVRGFSRFPNKKLKFFILAFVFFQILTVSFTSENWDGRFLLSLLPWIFLLAGFGVYRNKNVIT